MTRDQPLTIYRPICAGIQRILRAAVKSCFELPPLLFDNNPEIPLSVATFGPDRR
jgi:hypothetical protein